MKKKIQKYLAGEREGFSLVELIIVIAIMAILIGVVTLAVLPNIAKSKESKDITALDSILSALNSAVASQQVSKDGGFSMTIANNEADLTDASGDKDDGKKVREEVIKLMGKQKIGFTSSKVCATNNALHCQWKFDKTTGEISIEAAIVTAKSGNTAVVGDYMGTFASSNGKAITTPGAAAPSAT